MKLQTPVNARTVPKEAETVAYLAILSYSWGEYLNANTDVQTPVNHRNHEAAAAPDVVDVLPPAVYTGRRSPASLGATMALSGVSVGRLELPKSWLKPG